MKKEENAGGKWYEQFTQKKTASKKSSEKRNDGRKSGISDGRNFDGNKRSGERKENGKKPDYRKNFSESFEGKRKDGTFLGKKVLFDAKKIPADSISVLENFDSIVQGVCPMNSKQFNKLPKDILALSHQLTDQREDRRMGYMNAKEEFSAYLRYFTWWNLVRLTRVFSNLPEDAFDLKDDDVCIDLGTGPLTVVISLWLSRPELRNRKLTWYCVDLSPNSMSVGEELYLSVAAKVRPSDENAPSHWNIIRVKGESGVSIKQKASLITSANMFNELAQKSGFAPDELAVKQMKILKDYSCEKTAFFLAEPGMPVAAHFISLMRDQMLKNNFSIVAPCPHMEKCPMSGLHARYGGSAKWCNFSFETQEVPQKLLKLSESAKLQKDRAVISFVYGKKKNSVEENKKENDAEKGKVLKLRIASDPIRLPDYETGYYSCSEVGLVLAVTKDSGKTCSGDCIELNLKNQETDFEKDKKSGAKIIRF